MNRRANEALFITLEGIEGVGKSTHLSFVEGWLRRLGRRVLVTREPGGTAVGEAIRAVLLDRKLEPMTGLTELLLLFAARAEHLAKVIRPALGEGIDVVCDRFTDATYAYQGGGRGLPQEWVALLEGLVQQGLEPDLTLVLDCPVDIAMQRVGRRGASDRFENERAAFFERVRAAYADRARRLAGRMRLIDASRDIAEVRTEIAAHLQSLLAAA